MVFYWRLSDRKFPQVSWTLLSILADLNNVVVWMVSTRPPTSKSSSPFNNPLVIVPNAPITIGIIVTCMFHSFFNSLARSRYLSFFLHSFSFILWSAGTVKSTILQVLFPLLLWLGLVFWPRLSDLCVCPNPIGVYVCYFPGQVLGCAYTIFIIVAVFLTTQILRIIHLSIIKRFVHIKDPPIQALRFEIIISDFKFLGTFCR